MAEKQPTRPNGTRLCMRCEARPILPGALWCAECEAFMLEGLQELLEGKDAGLEAAIGNLLTDLAAKADQVTSGEGES